MGTIKQVTKTRTTFLKSKMKKDSTGQYHCPTCGAFRSTSKKKKK